MVCSFQIDIHNVFLDMSLLDVSVNRESTCIVEGIKNQFR